MTQKNEKRIFNRKNALLRAGAALMVCFLFFAIHFFGGNPHFENGDDCMLNAIAAGAFGKESSAYLIFENIVYGYLLKGLYALFPAANMYLIFMLTANIAAIFFLCFAAGEGFLRLKDCRECSARSGVCYTLLISAGVNLLFSAEFYEVLQWTKNAGLYCACGMMLLFSWFYRGAKLKDCFWIPAVLFSVLGYCVRRESFMAISGIAVVCFLGLLFIRALETRRGTEEKKMGRGRVETEKKALFIPLLLAASVIFCFFVNRASYSAKEWKTFSEYNMYRSLVLDFGGVPSYKEMYDSIGFDEVDRDLLAQWTYADPEKYSLEAMKTIAAPRMGSGRIKLDGKTVLSAVFKFRETLFKNALSACWALLLLIAVCKRRPDLILLHMVITVGILGEYYYLLCRGHFNWRVEALPWVAANAVFMGVLTGRDNGRQKQSGAARGGIALLLSVCIFMLDGGSCFSNFVSVKKGVVFEQNNKGDILFDYMEENKDSFYVITTKTAVLSKNIRGLRNYTREFSNSSQTGGWNVPAPFMNSALKQYGIQNTIKALADSSVNVFLVDKTELHEKIKEYLTKEMGAEVNVERVALVGDYPIWKFSIGS